MMASVAGDRASVILGLLRDALAQMRDASWRPIALLFLVFLGSTNAALVLLKPAPGDAPGAWFALVGLIRVAALISISVAALRIATDSPRRRWMPDAAWGLYLLLGLLSLAVAAAGAWLGRGLPLLPRMLLVDFAGLVLLVPLSVWLVAAAVERPLAWSPLPGWRRFGAWLAPMLVWSVLLAAPLALLHAWLSLRLIDAAGTASFWPLAALDAAASSLFILVDLALGAAAYSRVAQG